MFSDRCSRARVKRCHDVAMRWSDPTATPSFKASKPSPSSPKAPDELLIDKMNSAHAYLLEKRVSEVRNKFEQESIRTRIRDSLQSRTATKEKPLTLRRDAVGLVFRNNKLLGHIDRTRTDEV